MKKYSRSTLTSFVREAALKETAQLRPMSPKEYPHGVSLTTRKANTVVGMSRNYMPLYVAEFQFRYNNRENHDIFGTAIGRC